MARQSTRATVRAAVADFFSDPPVEGLSKVHRSPPRMIGADEFYSGAPAGSVGGAVALVHIDRQSEYRRAFGGATSGVKQRSYLVLFFILARSSDADFEAANDSLDITLEAITSRLQGDRTLGGRVFQAGEGRTDHPVDDIEVTANLPRRVSNQWHTWVTVRFWVVEMLQT